MALQILSTDCNTCQENILEGNSLTIPLSTKPLGDNDRFWIKRDDFVVVPRRTKGQVGPGTLQQDRFLILPNLTLADAGTYTHEVFDGKGNPVGSPWSLNVCVYGKTFGIINVILLQIFLVFNGREKKN